MSDSASSVRTRTHWPLLLLALTILVVTTVWPHSLSNEAGQADHLLAMLVFWAMCASFYPWSGVYSPSSSVACAVFNPCGRCCPVGGHRAGWRCVELNHAKTV